MDRLRLTPSANITPTATGVMLRSDLGTFQLTGNDIQVFVNEIVPFLDGRYSKSEIARKFSKYTAESVLGLLGTLERAGMLESVSRQAELNDHWKGQFEFFSKWTEKPADVINKVRTARVLIVGLSPWGVIAATELAAAGVGAVHLLDDGVVAAEDLVLVRVWNEVSIGSTRREALRDRLSVIAPWCKVTHAPLVLAPDRSLVAESRPFDLILIAVPADDLLVQRAVAVYAHRTGTVSLYGHLEGLQAVVGPAVAPGETACWNCTRLRLLANSEFPEAIGALQESLLNDRPPKRAHTYLGPMPGLLGNLLSTEALKLLSKYSVSRLFGRLLIQDLVDLEASYHAVIRMPWCEVCSTPEDDVLEPAATMLGTDSSSRRKKKLGNLSNYAQLLSELEGWIDDRTGIIRRLAVNVPEDDDINLPITVTCLLSNYTEGNPGRQVEPLMSSGKGLTPFEATIGAVGEALERYSAARYRRDTLLRASLSELREDCLDPSLLPQYTEEQYNSPDFPFARFNPDQEIHWKEGYWLDTGKPVWLPALLSYYDFDVPKAERFTQVSSNGLAAGEDLIDASLRATFELVERDAFMTAWHCRLPGRRIIPDAADNGCLEVLRQIGRHGTEVELYLLNAGIDIPVVLCLALGDGKNWPGVTVSLAAHPTTRIAVRKAVLEQGAVGPYIRRMMLNEEPIPQSPNEVRSLNEHAMFYAPVERRGVLSFLRSDATPIIALSETEELSEVSPSWVAQRLAAEGVRVAIADVTSPDVRGSQVRVARAIGVGIQPIDFGFALRRLVNPRLKKRMAGEPNPYPHPLA